MKYFQNGREVFNDISGWKWPGGGQGKVNPISGGRALKVLNDPDALNDPDLQKLLKKRWQAPIAFPETDLVTDERGVTVGMVVDLVNSKVEWNNTNLPIAERLEYAEQLCRIVQSLHDNGVLRMDLNPDNFLLDSGNNHLVMIDFDGCVLEPTGGNRGVPKKGRIVEPKYWDPAADEITRRTDWYGVAMVLYPLFYGGRSPYAAKVPGFGQQAAERKIKQIGKPHPDTGNWVIASAFHPKAKLLPGHPGHDIVPKEWVEWLEAVLQRKELALPPCVTSRPAQTAQTAPAAATAATAGTPNVAALHRQIAKLEAKNAKLEAKNAKLEAENTRLKAELAPKRGEWLITRAARIYWQLLWYGLGPVWNLLAVFGLLIIALEVFSGGGLSDGFLLMARNSNFEPLWLYDLADIVFRLKRFLES